jgi:hypothetical protein
VQVDGYDHMSYKYNHTVARHLPRSAFIQQHRHPFSTLICPAAPFSSSRPPESRHVPAVAPARAGGARLPAGGRRRGPRRLQVRRGSGQQPAPLPHSRSRAGVHALGRAAGLWSRVNAGSSAPSKRPAAAHVLPVPAAAAADNTWHGGPTPWNPCAPNLVRGPRLKMGLREGVPKSICPDHLGR